MDGFGENIEVSQSQNKDNGKNTESNFAKRKFRHVILKNSYLFYLKYHFLANFRLGLVGFLLLGI